MDTQAAPVHGSDDARDATRTPWYLTATTLAAVPWLARLRWARAAVDALVVAISLALPSLDFPLRRVAALLAVTALLNAAAAIRLSRGQPSLRALPAIELLLLPLLLTELLELTGGPFNPFAVVYVVPVALAGLTLGATYGVLVTAVSAGGYSLLAFWHLTELVPGHHRLNDFPTHLFTMWFSIAMTAELAAYFLVQASNALAKREQQLDTMRRHASRADRLVSLTTLAAGAAHELSTPLGTIALAARELEHSAAERGTVPDLADDARLIRTEVDRCRAILDQMSGRAGGSTTDEPEDLTVQTLRADIEGRLSPDRSARLAIDVSAEPYSMFLPRSGLAQAVLALITNAMDATDTPEDSPVRMHIDTTPERLSITVVDTGPGLSPDALRRAGEPFFTTKDPGRGLGLGLFLARVFAERVGGTLTLESDNGTTATLQVPLRVTRAGDTT